MTENTRWLHNLINDLDMYTTYFKSAGAGVVWKHDA